MGRLLKRHSRHVDVSLSFVEQVADLRRRACLSLDPTDIDTISEVIDACDQLLEYESEDTTVDALMKRLRDNQGDLAIAAGVHVLNAHVGKGQQFDWVIVMGLEEGHVPDWRNTKDERILEEQRMLLVMLSRARKGLILTCASSYTNKSGRTFHCEPSRWWEEATADCMPIPDDLEHL